MILFVTYGHTDDMQSQYRALHYSASRAVKMTVKKVAKSVLYWKLCCWYLDFLLRQYDHRLPPAAWRVGWGPRRLVTIETPSGKVIADYGVTGGSITGFGAFRASKNTSDNDKFSIFDILLHIFSHIHAVYLCLLYTPRGSGPRPHPDPLWL